MNHPDRPADRCQALSEVAAANTTVELTADGRVIDCSPGFAAATGLPRDRIVGRSLADAFASTDLTEIGGFFARVMQGETVRFEPKHVTHDGRKVAYSVTCAPVRDAEGRPTQILALVVDISRVFHEAEAMQALVASFSRSQAVIEFTPEGEVVTANQNFLDALGYRLDEIKGRHHRLFVDPSEAASPAYGEFWRALQRGESQTGEFRRLGKSGDTVWISATYTAVTDDRGKVNRVVKFATDVTGRKTAVDRLIAGISRLAEGDLTATIEDSLSGEFREVGEVFNRARRQFSDMVEEIRARGETMQAEAGSIAGGADDLARRGETQAASLEETAAAVEEISGNVASTSQSAREADESARSAEQIVRSGASVVTEAIAAMERIESHTRNMAEFTRVIENFAFQTNLLSINAAVEAARAGEVGRGFAVVANEVRNLAQQSAKASQSIAELIGKSETEVTTGVRLVRDAGGALERISAAVAAMASNVAGIAHATTEQATGVREVSEALSQLDSVNQSNLTLSDSNAAAAGQLSVQVEEMNQLLERFRTGGATGTRPPATKSQIPLRRSA